MKFWFIYQYYQLSMKFRQCTSRSSDMVNQVLIIRFQVFKLILIIAICIVLLSVYLITINDEMVKRFSSAVWLKNYRRSFERNVLKNDTRLKGYDSTISYTRNFWEKKNSNYVRKGQIVFRFSQIYNISILGRGSYLSSQHQQQNHHHLLKRNSPLVVRKSEGV